MANIEFEDYSIKVIAELDNAKTAFLHEAAGEIEAQLKRTTPVKSGILAGSWQYLVKDDTAYIGSPINNSIWNEFGTGQYAIKGDGRKTPWVYQDAKGNWYTTTGKQPQRTLQKAFASQKTKLPKLLAQKLKGLK